MEDGRGAALFGVVVVTDDLASGGESILEGLNKHFGLFFKGSGLVFLWPELTLSVYFKLFLITLITLHTPIFSFAVEFVIHVPVDFLMFGWAIEDFIAEAAAFVGIFLADGTSIHLFSLFIFIISGWSN